MCLLVAPFTGAWIETPTNSIRNCLFFVAPFTGAWIETIDGKTKDLPETVAPFTGAWIETPKEPRIFGLPRSLPSRERGLKHWF